MALANVGDNDKTPTAFLNFTQLWDCYKIKYAHQITGKRNVFLISLMRQIKLNHRPAQYQQMQTVDLIIRQAEERGRKPDDSMM